MMNPHQATNPPEEPNPWPCACCGWDTHETNKRGDVAPICDECIKEWYTCPVCEEEFDYKSETDNQPCDDICKSQYLELRNEKGV
jgi:hypothetical protein